MPKRSHSSDDDSDYCNRKRKKIEKIMEKIKRREKRSRRRISSGSDSWAPASPAPAPAVALSALAPVSPPLQQSQGENENRPELVIHPIIIDDTEPGPSTSKSVQPTEEESVQPELDEEILSFLGQTPSKERKLGPEIQTDLALRLEHTATTGLTKELKKELLNKYLIPKNCTKIDAPKLNPEIKAALSEILIKKDKALENKQRQLAAAISCIGDVLSKMFTAEHRDQTIIKLLIEASRLMCDAQYTKSMTRRSFICSTIKKEIKDHLYNTEIDSFLFGEKLADTLKAAKAITKSGAEIKVAAKKTSAQQKPRQQFTQSLNQKPPLPLARQTRVTRRTDPARPPPQPQPQPPRQPPRSQPRRGPRR